jgi:hypothetical protein
MCQAAFNAAPCKELDVWGMRSLHSVAPTIIGISLGGGGGEGEYLDNPFYPFLPFSFNSVSYFAISRIILVPASL